MNNDTDIDFERWYNSTLAAGVIPTISTAEHTLQHLTNVRISDSIQLGTHIFSPQELGDLLSLLLQLYPELRI